MKAGEVKLERPPRKTKVRVETIQPNIFKRDTGDYYVTLVVDDNRHYHGQIKTLEEARTILAAMKSWT